MWSEIEIPKIIIIRRRNNAEENVEETNIEAERQNENAGKHSARFEYEQ